MPMVHTGDNKTASKYIACACLGSPGQGGIKVAMQTLPSWVLKGVKVLDSPSCSVGRGHFSPKRCLGGARLTIHGS